MPRNRTAYALAMTLWALPAWAGPSAAPKSAAKILFYRGGSPTKGGVPTDQFKAGEVIFAVASFDKPVGEMAGGDGNVALTIEVAGSSKSFGGIRVPVSKEGAGEKSVGFFLLGPQQNEKEARTFVEFLKQLPKGNHAMAVGAGYANQAQGKFKLDLSEGAAAYDALLASSEKATIAANANVALPVAAQANPKLEADILAMLAKANPHMKVFKVVLKEPGWTMQRHELTGAILSRSQTVALLSQQAASGTCQIEPVVLVRQTHLGNGKYGALELGGGSATPPIKVPCDKFSGLK